MHPKDVVGRRGEQLAAECLQNAGCRILDRNFRCAKGEIDIAAADRRDLMACEVKTRSATRLGPGAEAVTRPKLSRLRDLAVAWSSSHGFIDRLRVGIVRVPRSGSGLLTIGHLGGVR
jgi:putative endonuclease